jgi:hypothetical protein
MKQAFFAAFEANTSMPPPGMGLFQPPSCGLPLDLEGDIRPCAASPGLTYEQLADLTPIVGYVPPRGTTEGHDAPVSLALLSTETGRILSHGGVAPAHNGFPAHSFTHVLLDIPPTLDPQQAIQTWGSDRWQRSAADGLGTLEDALFPPVAQQLDDAAFTKFLEESTHRELFQFVLAAFLGTAPETHIYLATPAEEVAQCVYGLTRVLPATVLEGLTFSTYERHPLQCAARIVGTVPDSTNRELPPICHDGSGVGLNTYTGTKTSLNTEIAFVAFAVQLAAEGQYTPIDDFRATWQRLNLRDAGLLDVVYRLGRGPDAITKAEVIQALQNPALAAWVCPRPEFQQMFLTCAFDDVDFATTTFPRVVAALRSKPEHLSKLAEQIHEAGRAAVAEGQLTKARGALEVLLPMVAPARGQAVWGELLQGQDPASLTWEMRAYLMPKLARLRPLNVGQPLDPDMRRWLHITAEHLTPMLGLSLSQGYQLAACLELLHGDRENLGTVAHAVASNANMALTLIQQLLATDDDRPLAHDFFVALLKESPRPAWLNDIVTLQPAVPADYFNDCLGAALNVGAPAIDPIPFVRQHGPALLDRLAGQDNLDRLAAKVLEGQAGEHLSDPALRSFFLGLEGKPGLSRAVEERLGAVLTVYRYEEQPSVERARLDQVAAALQQPELFAETTKRRLLDQAVRTLGTASFQDDLIHLLLSWAPLFDGPSKLYREVLHRFQEYKTFWRNQDQVLAFLAVALDATPSEELNSRTEGLEAEAFGLVDAMVQRGGKKLWAQLDARTIAWPRSARRQWQFLSRAVLPEKGRGFRRDLVAALLGAALMAAAFVALRWYQLL